MTNKYVVVDGSVQELPNAGFAELLTAVLAKNVPFRFQASGYSMSPFIRDVDVLTLLPAPPHLRLGDIVAFINPCNERLTVHRIINYDHHSYLIRGDNTPEADGWIPKEDILGRVIRVEHLGRSVRIGLGPERVGIALLSRFGWLVRLMVPFRFIHNIQKK